MTDTIIQIPFVSRRAAVAGGLAAFGGGAAAFCQGRSPAPDTLTTASPGAACLLYPQATEGPYYFDPKLERSNVTEGKAGSPVRLVIGVQGADCKPLAGARVDIWHCDAQGTYSGYAGGGQADATGKTFLRGWMPTDAKGEATFQTIYPGWYPGRTTHIHLKVIIGERAVLTSQLYFPEALNDAIYDLPAYARSRRRETQNANDGVLRGQGASAFGSVTEEGEGHLVRLLVGVDPSAPALGQGPGRRP